MEIEIRHLNERLRSDDDDLVRVYRVFRVDDGHGKELFDSTDYPEALARAKAEALQAGAPLFELRQKKRQPRPLPSYWPAMALEKSPGRAPRRYSLVEGPDTTDVKLPGSRGGWGLPEWIGLGVFTAGIVGIALFGGLAIQDFRDGGFDNLSGGHVFGLLFAAALTYTFNYRRIARSAAPRREELRLGPAGLRIDQWIGEEHVRNELPWDAIEDLLIERSPEWNYLALYVVTKDRSIAVGTFETMASLIWVRDTVRHGASRFRAPTR